MEICGIEQRRWSSAPFCPGSVVEIEGANILNLRRRHLERRTFEQDPGAKE